MAQLLPITDYQSLQAAIKAMADRNDAEYVDSIPLFIQQAEIRFFRHLRCPGNEVRALYPAANGDNSLGIEIPQTFLELRQFYYGPNLLERITDQALAAKYMQNPAAKGTPKYVARVIDKLNIYPQADSNMDINMVFWEFQGPLTFPTQWTRMLRIAPFAYLYGALAEGARFTRDKVMFDEWNAVFAAEGSEINAQAYANEADGSTVVVNHLGGGW